MSINTQQYEFEYVEFGLWKQGLIISLSILPMLACIGIAIWIAETYHINEYIEVLLILTFAFGGASLLVWLISNEEKLRRRGKAKVNIIGYQILLIEKDSKVLEIPISAIHSYTIRIHHNKFNDKDTVEWIIRYLPRKKISLCVSSDDVLDDDVFGDDDNLLAIANARVLLSNALDKASNHTIYKKPNFFTSTSAVIMTWMTAIGFVIFFVVSSYLTGKFNIGLLMLLVIGVTTPFIALHMLRAESLNSTYTMCNPKAQKP